MNKKCTDKYIEEIKARLEIGHETDEHTYRDIPALLSEVERLTKENATLKKALRLACEGVPDCPAIWNEPPFKQCKNCKSEENFEECWYRYFIQQAQNKLSKIQKQEK